MAHFSDVHPAGVAKFEVGRALVTASGGREARRGRSSRRRSRAAGAGSSTGTCASDSDGSGLGEETAG